MTTKHTPGPWTADREYTGGHVIRAADGFITAETHQGGETDKANARLIAAAPELLAALREMVDFHTAMIRSGDCGHWDPESDAPVIAARAAIAKAEGRGE